MTTETDTALAEARESLDQHVYKTESRGSNSWLNDYRYLRHKVIEAARAAERAALRNDQVDELDARIEELQNALREFVDAESDQGECRYQADICMTHICSRPCLIERARALLGDVYDD